MVLCSKKVRLVPGWWRMRILEGTAATGGIFYKAPAEETTLGRQYERSRVCHWGNNNSNPGLHQNRLTNIERKTPISQPYINKIAFSVAADQWVVMCLVHPKHTSRLSCVRRETIAVWFTQYWAISLHNETQPRVTQWRWRCRWWHRSHSCGRWSRYSGLPWWSSGVLAVPTPLSASLSNSFGVLPVCNFLAVNWISLPVAAGDRREPTSCFNRQSVRNLPTSVLFWNIMFTLFRNLWWRVSSFVVQQETSFRLRGSWTLAVSLFSHNWTDHRFVPEQHNWSWEPTRLVCLVLVCFNQIRKLGTSSQNSMHSSPHDDEGWGLLEVAGAWQRILFGVCLLPKTVPRQKPTLLTPSISGAVGRLTVTKCFASLPNHNWCLLIPEWILERGFTVLTVSCTSLQGSCISIYPKKSSMCTLQREEWECQRCSVAMWIPMFFVVFVLFYLFVWFLAISHQASGRRHRRFIASSRTFALFSLSRFVMNNSPHKILTENWSSGSHILRLRIKPHLWVVLTTWEPDVCMGTECSKRHRQ